MLVALGVAELSGCAKKGDSFLLLDLSREPADLAVARVEIAVRSGAAEVANQGFDWPTDGRVRVCLARGLSGEMEIEGIVRDGTGEPVAGGRARAVVTAGNGSGTLVLRPLPQAPQPIAPLDGEDTGSVWQEASRKPRFRWKSVAGAIGYELQVDDSCPASGFSDCEFGSPEVLAEGLSAVEYQPDSLLAVSTTAPVGRRYFWRVRSCSGDGCSLVARALRERRAAVEGRQR